MQHTVKANPGLQKAFGHGGGHGAVHRGPSAGSHAVAEHGNQPSAAILKDGGAVPAEGSVFGAVLGEAPAHAEGGTLAHLNAAFPVCVADAGRGKGPAAGGGDLFCEHSPVQPLPALPANFRLHGHPAELVQAAADLNGDDAVVQQHVLHPLGGLLVKVLIQGKLPGHLVQNAGGGLEMPLHRLPDLGCPELCRLLDEIAVIIFVDLVPHFSGPAAALDEILGEIGRVRLSVLLQDLGELGEILHRLVPVFPPADAGHAAARADGLRCPVIDPLQVGGAEAGQLFGDLLHRGVNASESFSGMAQAHDDVIPQRAAANGVPAYAEKLGQPLASGQEHVNDGGRRHLDGPGNGLIAPCVRLEGGHAVGEDKGYRRRHLPHGGKDPGHQAAQPVGPG